MASKNIDRTLSGVVSVSLKHSLLTEVADYSDLVDEAIGLVEQGARIPANYESMAEALFGEFEQAHRQWETDFFPHTLRLAAALADPKLPGGPLLDVNAIAQNTFLGSCRTVHLLTITAHRGLPNAFRALLDLGARTDVMVGDAKFPDWLASDAPQMNAIYQARLMSAVIASDISNEAAPSIGAPAAPAASAVSRRRGGNL